MFALELEKIVQTECLVAFAHSRITGILGKDQEGQKVFDNISTEQEIIEIGNSLAEAIKDLATVESINYKITNGTNALTRNMYHNFYTKLTYLTDKYLKENEIFIESLIGLHLLILATEKGLLSAEDGSNNLEFYKYTLGFYENVQDEKGQVIVKKMEVVSKAIFEDYWRKKKKGKNAKSLESYTEFNKRKETKALRKEQSKIDKEYKEKYR